MTRSTASERISSFISQFLMSAYCILRFSCSSELVSSAPSSAMAAKGLKPEKLCFCYACGGKQCTRQTMHESTTISSVIRVFLLLAAMARLTRLGMPRHEGGAGCRSERRAVSTGALPTSSRAVELSVAEPDRTECGAAQRKPKGKRGEGIYVRTSGVRQRARVIGDGSP